jgi:hypothetical protein
MGKMTAMAEIASKPRDRAGIHIQSVGEEDGEEGDHYC